MKSNPLAVTKRDDVGRPLSYVEGDTNFQQLKNVIYDAQQHEKDLMIAASGFIPLKSFLTGCVITSKYQAVYDEANDQYYTWNGSLPKTIAVDSTVASAGGLGPNAFVVVPVTSTEQKLLSKLQVGTFAQGLTLTQSLHKVYDNLGNTWVYSGTLPFLIVAGYSPIGQADWAIERYIDTVVSDTVPPSYMRKQGIRWFNPDLPATFIFYNDGVSSQWVEEL